MRFEVWFTIDATDEAARMTQGWTYWPAFFIRNLNGIVLVAALLIAGFWTFVKSLLSPEADLRHAAVGVLLMLIPVGGFWWFRSRDIRTATEMLAKDESSDSDVRCKRPPHVGEKRRKEFYAMGQL